MNTNKRLEELRRVRDAKHQNSEAYLENKSLLSRIDFLIKQANQKRDGKI
ncbi:MAG TPA: hypothetical protein PKJ33_01960 [Alphaproteobacteria bacterium]|nr:hypothetical protein [Alphaproteobacteria bacterium]